MSAKSSIWMFPAHSEVTLEEYWLYSMIIMERFNRSAREQFVIRQELAASTPLVKGNSSLDGRIHEWRSNLPGLTEETAHAFVQRSCEPALLGGYFDLPLPYSLLSEDESAEIWDWNDECTFSGHARDGWMIFRQRYPNAGPIISFSRIGFNRRRTQALLEVGVRAHWSVSGGSLLLLQNTDDGWKIDKRHGLWVS